MLSWSLWEVENGGCIKKASYVAKATQEQIINVLESWNDWEHGNGFYEENGQVEYFIYPGNGSSTLSDFDIKMELFEELKNIDPKYWGDYVLNNWDK